MKELRQGDIIGIVSPASAPDEAVYQFCHAFIESRGFRVKIFGMEEPSFGRMAGSDQARLDNLHAAFRDPEVDAILGISDYSGIPGVVRKIVNGSEQRFVATVDGGAPKSAKSDETTVRESCSA